MLLFFLTNLCHYSSLPYGISFLESIDHLLPFINNICLEITESDRYPRLKNTRNIKCLKINRSLAKNLLELPVNLSYLKMDTLCLSKRYDGLLYNLKDLRTLILPNNILCLDGIENLKKLRYLDMQGSDGEFIPNGIFTLRLRRINFSKCFFRHLRRNISISLVRKYRELYTTIIYKLMSITSELILRNNFLSKVTLEYSNSELYHLNLSFNNLTQVSEDMLKLKSLKILNLSYNDLSEIPKFLFRMELKELYLSNNCLEIIHMESRSLELLDISSNKHIINLKLDKLNSLKSLSVDLNDNISIDKLDITDLFIDIIYLTKKPILDLKNLKNLHIHLSKFSTFPEIKSPLEELTITRDKYSADKDADKIFKELSKMPKLKILKISGSFLKIPKSVYKMINLKELHLTDGYMTKIPKNICKMPNLQHLNLSNNFIRKFNSKMNKNMTINLQNNNLNGRVSGIYNIRYKPKKNIIRRVVKIVKTRAITNLRQIIR